MTKQKRAVALLLAAFLCLAVVFSAVFICAEADHDCTGLDCSICDCIHTCENTLKTLGTAVLAIACALVSASLMTVVKEHVVSVTRFATLISLKVKLSN